MLWLAPAGLRGGIKLEAYHQSRQPLPFSPCGPWCSGTSVRSTRDVLLRQPYLRPRRRPWLRVAAQASRTSHSGCSCSSRRCGVMYHVLSRQACLSLSGRRCGVTACQQSRRRRWDCLVFLKGGRTSVRESLFLLVIVAGLVLSGSRCSSPAHCEAHFRSPSAFDEFFLGSQRETTELPRSTQLRVPHFTSRKTSTVHYKSTTDVMIVSGIALLLSVVLVTLSAPSSLLSQAQLETVMSESASSTGNFNIIAFVEFGLGPENLPFGMEFFPLRLCSRLSSMPTSPSSTGLAPFFGYPHRFDVHSPEDAYDGHCFHLMRTEQRAIRRTGDTRVDGCLSGRR